LLPLSHLLPPLPGFLAPDLRAVPGMVRQYNRPCPIRDQPKKRAIRLWHRAREFDRQTHEPGRHGGAVGRTALAAMHALTGRLDPSYVAISCKAGACVCAVSDALKRARELGLLHRIRRCVDDWQDGQFRLRQETNVYLAAAGELLARLEAACRAVSLQQGSWAIQRLYRWCRAGGPGARSRDEGGRAQNGPRWRPGGRAGEPRSEPLEPARIVVLPKCRSCGETRPRLALTTDGRTARAFQGGQGDCGKEARLHRARESKVGANTGTAAGARPCR